MTKVILILNQKGGVGKTTIADELAFALERQGKRVAFSNLDNQGGCIHELTISDTDDDYQIVDTPGILSDQVGKWCKGADLILMPVTPSEYDRTPFERTYNKVRESKTDAKVGVILNCFDSRRIVDKEFDEYLRQTGKDIWAYLPRTTAIVKAQAARISVVEFAPKNKAAQAFGDLCKCVEQHLEN